MPLECHCGGEKFSRLQKDTKHKNIAKNNTLFTIYKRSLNNSVLII